MSLARTKQIPGVCVNGNYPASLLDEDGNVDFPLFLPPFSDFTLQASSKKRGQSRPIKGARLNPKRFFVDLTEFFCAISLSYIHSKVLKKTFIVCSCVACTTLPFRCCSVFRTLLVIVSGRGFVQLSATPSIRLQDACKGCWACHWVM